MASPLAAGDKAPPFELPTDGDGRVALADFKGKKLILYFYPSDDTPTCTFEAIEFNRLRPRFKAAGAEILGVSADSAKSHDKFKKKHGLSLVLGSDEAKDMLHAYGVWGEKTLFGRKYMGIERSTFLIDEKGKIARIWRKVLTPGHAEEVLEEARK